MDNNRPMKAVTKLYFLQLRLKQLKRSESYLFNKQDLRDFRNQIHMLHTQMLMEQNRHLALIEQLQREANVLERAYNCNEEDKRNIKLLFQQL